MLYTSQVRHITAVLNVWCVCVCVCVCVCMYVWMGRGGVDWTEIRRPTRSAVHHMMDEITMIAGFIAPQARITSHRVDTPTSCMLTRRGETVTVKTEAYISS